MTILDSYAVISLLRDEPAANEVEDLLLNTEARLTAVGVSEVVDRMVRLLAVDEEEIALDLAQLDLAATLEVDDDLGLAAGMLRARRYQRRTCQLSLADCVAAEGARRSGERLATADPDLLSTCSLEGIGYISLPDSTGARWTV